MELRYALQLTRTWWWLLALCAVAGAVAGHLFTLRQEPEYRASATLLVNQVQAPGTVTYNDVLASERLTETYRQLVESLPVLEDAQEELSLPGGTAELAHRLKVEAVPNTQLIRISGWAESPEQAAAIANTTANVVLARNRTGQFGTRGSLSLVEAAVTPATPANRPPLNPALLGAVAGLILAGGLALLIDYMDDRVRDPERLRLLGLPLLGSVRRMKRSASPLVGREAPASPEAEAYRVIRTAIQFAFLDRPLRSLFVTSAQAGEGKTTTAANLAIATAQTGKRVVILDADLRRPRVHQIFGLDNRRGLTDLVLQGGGHFGEFLRETGVRNCWALTSGPLPPNPDAVLTSTRFRQMVDQLAASADLLVIDGPPVLPTADAGHLAHLADGTILVVNARRTRRAAAARALAALQHAAGAVVGAVLNQVPDRSVDAYYGYRTPHSALTPAGGVQDAAAPAGWRDTAA